MTTQMTEQRLTIAAAQARLPLVRRIVRDVVQLNKQIVETRERLDEMRSRRGEKTLKDIYGEEWLAIEIELEQDRERLIGFVDELAQLGAKMLDVQLGTVGFLSERGGQGILLSWMYDEPRIEFWHEINQGPAQRVPLEMRQSEKVNRIESRFDEKI